MYVYKFGVTSEPKETTIEVKLDTKDYKLLKEWGFMFEKNIQEYIKGIADEMRSCIEENNKA